MCEMSTREALQRLKAQGFQWEAGHIGRDAQHVLNSRLPKGKQVFSINHIAYVNSLGTDKSHSYQLVNANNSPKTQVPRQ